MNTETDQPTIATEPSLNTLTWDPVLLASELASKISARTRHVCIFLGAGASCAAGLPALPELQAGVLAKLEGDHKKLADTLFQHGNFEAGLSRLRRIHSLLEAEQVFEGFTKASAHELDQALTHAIIDVLEAVAPNLKPAIDFCNWAAGDYYARPIELFTVNYDLILEHGLESIGAPYFDGFVGNINARFRGDLVETTGSALDAFPSSFVRLWKLHGSVNWQMTNEGVIVRKGQPLATGNIAAIYPSDEKYDQSRRVPFVILQDRLRKALAMPETLTMICGYSFGDQHLNEIIYDAARRYPRSEVVVLCRNDIPTDLKSHVLGNLSVYGGTEAIVGGELRQWSRPRREDAVENIWKDEKFLLGDFESFAGFISRSRRADMHPSYLMPLIGHPPADNSKAGE